MPISEVSPTETSALRDIAGTIASAKRVVVIAGAGISTSCGIPDFRSQTGLYNLTQSTSGSNSSTSTSSLPSSIKGKDLFSSQLWQSPQSTAAFYKFIASLRQSIRKDLKSISATHRFLKTIRDRRKLVRVYSQNIDGLETRAGLNADLEKGKGSRGRFAKKARDTPSKDTPLAGDAGCESVPLHGQLTHLRCTLCSASEPWSTTSNSLFRSGLAPPCPSCSTTSSLRTALGKRTCSTKVGSLRPDIVLYGEEHPQADAISEITQWDLGSKPDLLLILGTSLHVHGVKVLVREFAKAVSATRAARKSNQRGPGVVYVNLGRPSDSIWNGVIDVWVNMPCDAWVAATRKARPDIWSLQTRLSGKVSKPIPTVVIPQKEDPLPAKESAKAAVIADSEDDGEEDYDKENNPASPSLSKPSLVKGSIFKSSPLTNIPQKQRGHEKEPTTPRKSPHIIPDPTPNSQLLHNLPTPPPSSNNNNRKRKLPLMEKCQDNPSTPSKRPRQTMFPPTPPSSSTTGERKKKFSTTELDGPDLSSTSPPRLGRKRRPGALDETISSAASLAAAGAVAAVPSTPTTKRVCRRGRPPGSGAGYGNTRGKRKLGEEEVRVYED